MSQAIRFCSPIGHLVGASGQDESGQRRQISRSTQVSRQESVTHDDVAAQQVGIGFFVLGQ